MKSEWRKEKELRSLQTKIIGVAGLLYFVVLVLVAHYYNIKLS